MGGAEVYPLFAALVAKVEATLAGAEPAAR
jgi:hypothetical protein